VALGPLLWLLRDATPRRGALLGLIFGVAFFGATLYWILLFGEAAWTALTLMSAAFLAAFGAVAPALVRPRRPLLTAAGLAALWTLIEWVRGMWPLGGFTWGSLGVSQADDRVLLPLASVLGVWGLTFVVVAVNALLVEALAGGGAGGRRGGRVALAAGLMVAPALIPFARPPGSELDIAALQVDVRVPEGTPTAKEDLIVAKRHLDLHTQLLGQPPPDLVLWGEGALDPEAASDPLTSATVAVFVARLGVPTAIGAVLRDPDGKEYTSVLFLDGQGRPVDRYDKTHLVPFGEYVPWRERLDWFEALEQIPVDRVPGESVKVASLPGLPAFATPICFENSFPSLPRAAVRAGATFLVVPVNNASYGFTAASDQHLQMSRLRAVETGRWIVDAGVSGVTAFIDPSGRVVSRTELFRTAILRGQIRTSTEATWYVRLGDLLPWVCLMFVMGLVIAPRRRTEVRPKPEPLPRPFRTLVILPTYEERATIAEVIAGVLARPEEVDILVVDDSSPDGTADLVREIAAGESRVRLHQRPAKSGLATAYLEGFRIAMDEGYDLAVEMDSDLSHDPSQLSEILTAAAEGMDLVVGSRYIPGGSVSNWSRARVALSRAGNIYARFMLGIPLHDATSGYRAYRRRLIQELLARPFASDGYGFQIELVMRAHRLGFHAGEAPITFREREHGHSKISRRIVVEALWLVTKWGISLRLRRRPIR
jgi:apolipoprotein N-acyltransferase